MTGAVKVVASLLIAHEGLDESQARVKAQQLLDGSAQPARNPPLELDLAMLVKQLVRVVRLSHPDSALATRAMDFLQRHGLLGSPLREQLATAGMCENHRPSKLVDDFMEDVGLFARLYPPPAAVDRPTSSPDPDEPHQSVDSAPTLSRSEAAMAAAIDVLQAAGFAQDGATRTEAVRIPTKRSPVYGRSGGELVKLGGRMRFSQAGTSVKATVGKRTVAIYRMDGRGLDGVVGIATFDTSDLDRLKDVLQALG
jgi:hypothetical protein